MIGGLHPWRFGGGRYGCAPSNNGRRRGRIDRDDRILKMSLETAAHDTAAREPHRLGSIGDLLRVAVHGVVLLQHAESAPQILRAHARHRVGAALQGPHPSLLGQHKAGVGGALVAAARRGAEAVRWSGRCIWRAIRCPGPAERRLCRGRARRRPCCARRRGGAPGGRGPLLLLAKQSQRAGHLLTRGRRGYLPVVRFERLHWSWEWMLCAGTRATTPAGTVDLPGAKPMQRIYKRV